MAKRRTFFSFHYKPDNWRAGQVRNMGIVEGNASVSDNAWEEVTGGGESAIQEWINGQMKGRSCTIVLIGSKTADRKWIKYEIEKAWNDGKGLVGIYIHGLKNQEGEQSTKGKNPFGAFTVGKENLSDIVKAYDPPYKTSKYVFDHIADKIAEWVEEAIAIRGSY